jgi:putative transposase
MRYKFIDRQKKAFPVGRLCRLLNVSRSGYYDYMDCGGSQRPSDEMALMTRAREIHRQNNGVYGSRRLSQALQSTGYPVGRYRARTLMLKAGITVKRSKKFKVTTNSRHKYPVAPNLLNRQFDVDRPNSVWASDITYLWTREGWLYLATVMDLFSRKIVGWSVSNRINSNLSIGALKMALGNRRPESGLVHHSDQGVQYACHSYQQLLKANGLIPSMSRKGDCWDNAVAESFFSTLKTEQTHHRQYKTRQDAYHDIFDYIEVFYNRRRLHSYLGYVSPEDFEKGIIAA